MKARLLVVLIGCISLQVVGCTKRETDEHQTAAAVQDIAEMQMDILPETPQDALAVEEAVEEVEAKMVRTNVIAYEKDGFIWLVDPDGKNNEKLIEGRLIGWSPDGENIFYYTHHENEIVVKSINVSARSEQTILSGRDMTTRYRRIVAVGMSRSWPAVEIKFSSLFGCFRVRIGESAKIPQSNRINLKNNNSQDQSTYFCDGYWIAFPSLDDHCTCFSFAANGRIAYDVWETSEATSRRGAWNVHIVEPGKSMPVKLVSGRNPLFSPDGQYLIYEGSRLKHSLTMVKVENGEITPVANRGAYPSWLSGGRRILYHTFETVPGSSWCGGPPLVCGGPSWRGRLNIFDFTTGQSQRLRNIFVSVCTSPDYEYFDASAMSPDRARLAFVATDREGCGGLLAFLEIDSAEVTLSRVDWRQVAYLRPMLWSPDGSKIVVLDSERAFRVIDALSRLVIMTVNVSEDYDWLTPLSWSPDSKRLVYADNNTLFVVDTEAKTTTALTQGKNPAWYLPQSLHSSEDLPTEYRRDSSLQELRSSGKRSSPRGRRGGCPPDPKENPSWWRSGPRYCYPY